ncbi:hypothetical protein [Streptomyces sp. BPTC-684]|uniref:hypothetical protein n=1 Tax=Streptomyces sp. BPTC-684 TaxID=3043734 RepID=UPI0024B26CB7|nr:hypothetical protein [Streptomyces sp. BPTC-684]WHM40669.1 hypothetical protein QIY60_29875 [Streptomyces sp. BPTC-684]
MKLRHEVPWIRRKAAVSLSALALGTGGLAGLATAPAHAAPNSCLRSVGPVQHLSLNGHSIGDFIQGFNSCNRTTYAELHFFDLGVSQRATTGWIGIARDGGTGPKNGPPNGATWWDAGPIPVATSGTESYTAAFTFTWWTGSKNATCAGLVDWDYSRGNTLMYGVDCR